MDRKRALEIVQSLDLIAVNYKDAPVYLQQVDPIHNRARVFPLDNLHREFEVEITNLKERA
ncbi:H-type small acid-soluble spore protein [Ornithinibacillus contaminans]|uniref:H-type small acid-soluble spore protein n=1 Tax=Ornithinibacillus contaminans TaxID=694055 RepID=UPI00064DE88C|nr:H-type small acid-soluble spore protein [Ornithinibacillus contaminans]